MEFAYQVLNPILSAVIVFIFEFLIDRIPRIKRPRIYLDQIAETTVQAAILFRRILEFYFVAVMLSYFKYNLSDSTLSGVNLFILKMQTPFIIILSLELIIAFFLYFNFSEAIMAQVFAKYTTDNGHYLYLIICTALGTFTGFGIFLLICLKQFMQTYSSIESIILSMQLSLVLLPPLLVYYMFQFNKIFGCLTEDSEKTEIHLCNGEVIFCDQISRWYETKNSFRVWTSEDNVDKFVIIAKSSVIMHKIIRGDYTLNDTTHQWQLAFDLKIEKLHKMAKHSNHKSKYKTFFYANFVYWLFLDRLYVNKLMKYANSKMSNKKHGNLITAINELGSHILSQIKSLY